MYVHFWPLSIQYNLAIEASMRVYVTDCPRQHLSAQVQHPPGRRYFTALRCDKLRRSLAAVSASDFLLAVSRSRRRATRCTFEWGYFRCVFESSLHELTVHFVRVTLNSSCWSD